MKDNNFYVNEINRLRKEKNAVILSHYYQIPEIQDLADFVGDSLDLAKKSKSTDSSLIVFCGVHFMGETAKILNPFKKVIIPDYDAGCSLADGCNAKDLDNFIKKYPNHKVVTYVNASADVKVLSDIVVTSSNAEKIINSFPKDEKIIFAPDKNLGAFLNKKTGRNMVLWDGSCIVHESFAYDKIIEILKKHPDAELIAHPESEEIVLNISSFIGSTSRLLEYVKKSERNKFLVGTERGILHQMQKECPNKEFIEIPVKPSYQCNCSECFYMKMNTLEKLYLSLRDEKYEIKLNQEIIDKAVVPINRMLEFS